MATLSDIGVSAAINIATTFFFLLVFKVLKEQPANDRVYFPKLFLKGVRKGGNKKLERTVTKFFNLDYHAYLKFLDWWRPALQMSEQELIDHAGLDSAVFLRVFVLGLKIFIPVMVLGFCVLVPVNLADKKLLDTTHALNSTKTILYADVDKLSISNITNASQRLWAPLVMSYVFTCWICFVLYIEYKNVVAMRFRFNAAEENRPDQFTVLVRQVPSSPNESLSERVERFFRTNHRDYYLTHQMAIDANKLAGVVRRKETVQNWLDYEELKFARNPTTRPTIRTGFLGLCGQKVDAINHYSKKVEQLKSEFMTEREIVLSSDDPIKPAAFVAFKSRRGAAVCAQTQQTKDPTMWLTEWAPEPRDVYWPNLALRYASLNIRRLLITGATFLLVFFFMIPVAFVQSLANLEGLERRASWLKPIIERPFVKSFLQGFLPGLALKIFLLVLPHLLMFMSKVEGWLSLSLLDRKAAAKLYYFMVVNVFLGSIFTGSAFEQLDSFYKQSASQIPTTLGQAIPMKATFFITFIMVDGWAAVAGEILRLKHLILYHIKNMLIVKTDKDRAEAMDPGSAGFAELFPQLELYFLMGIVYSVVTPLITPFIVIFFGFGFVVYRHQVINVYDQEYESAGAFWPHIHSRIIASLLLEQLMLIGLFSIKEAPDSTPFLIGLPILTIVFHLYCKSRFEPAFSKYPLEEAVAKDNFDKPDSTGTTDMTDWQARKKYFEESYLHPVFKLDEDGEQPEEKSKDEPETAETVAEEGWVEEPELEPLTGSPAQVSHAQIASSSSTLVFHMSTQTSFNLQETPPTSLNGQKSFPQSTSAPQSPHIVPTTTGIRISPMHVSASTTMEDLVATRRLTHLQGAIGHDGLTDCSCAYCLL